MKIGSPHRSKPELTFFSNSNTNGNQPICFQPCLNNRVSKFWLLWVLSFTYSLFSSCLFVKKWSGRHLDSFVSFQSHSFGSWGLKECFELARETASGSSNVNISTSQVKTKANKLFGLSLAGSNLFPNFISINLFNIQLFLHRKSCLFCSSCHLMNLRFLV